MPTKLLRSRCAFLYLFLSDHSLSSYSFIYLQIQGALMGLLESGFLCYLFCANRAQYLQQINSLILLIYCPSPAQLPMFATHWLTSASRPCARATYCAALGSLMGWPPKAAAESTALILPARVSRRLVQPAILFCSVAYMASL